MAEEFLKKRAALSQQYYQYKKGVKELKENEKYFRRRVKGKYVYADGTVGYGRYRFRRNRRFARRRGRRVWRGKGGFWGDIAGAAAGYINDKFVPSSWRKYVGSPDTWRKVVSGLGAYEGNDRMRQEGMPTYIDQDVPQVDNPEGTDGAVRIKHREFLMDIWSGGANFTMQAAIPINPGSAACFPWLSQIAKRFTQYKLEGCIFHYKSTSGSLSKVTLKGRLIRSKGHLSGCRCLEN